jgi:hypothetical protein
MRTATLLAAVFASILIGQGQASSASRHVNATLQEVDGSGVTGRVELTQLPGGGTQITIVANGLKPGEEYLSLYYENHTCEVEEYEEDDVIGRYTANPGGVGTTTAKKGDDLDEINSVSVRRASDFALLSCADVHPGN